MKFKKKSTIILIASIISFYVNIKILHNDDLIYDSFVSYFSTDSKFTLSFVFLALNYFSLFLLIVICIFLRNLKIYFIKRLSYLIVFIVLLIVFLYMSKIIERIILIYLDLFYMYVFSFWVFCSVIVCLLFLFNNLKIPSKF